MHATAVIKFHVIGADIFTGKQKEALVSHHVLISRLEVNWERKELLNISDDLMCSLIGDENTVEEKVEVPDQVLGKAIQNFWADGERNVMLMTAEIMGIKGVVSAYEVVEIELLGIRETGVLHFYKSDDQCDGRCAASRGEKGGGD